MNVNDVIGRIWKEAAGAYFKALSYHWILETAENLEEPQ
jgi:hypothetical protein